MQGSRVAVVGAVVLGLSLAGCGGDDGAESSSTTPTPAVQDTTAGPSGGASGEVDVCGLLSEDDVAEILDAEIEEVVAVPAEGNDLGGCQWLALFPDGLTITARGADRIEADADTRGATPVEGLDGRAFDAGGAFGFLLELEGEDFYVRIVTDPRRSGSERNRAVAERILENRA